jgi:hypothetical protein
MRWVRDATGRFPRRPHYEAHELDAACDDLLKKEQLPLSTDALTVLIEQRAADLDLYADLSAEGADVEAVTDFVPGQRPRVRISERLSTDVRRGHRLRTTLAHELAHVVFHDFIWWFDQGALDAARARALSPRCHRRLGVQQSDWMEWQANYAAGALLMPRGSVRLLSGEEQAVWSSSARGRQRVAAVSRACDVSQDAARVRLEQLGLLTRRPLQVARAPVPQALLKRR